VLALCTDNARVFPVAPECLCFKSLVRYCDLHTWTYVLEYIHVYVRTCVRTYVPYTCTYSKYVYLLLRASAARTRYTVQ
jgi:hypothetical protein